MLLEILLSHFHILFARVFHYILFRSNSPAKSPAQLPAGKCGTALAGLAMESKYPTVPWHCGDDAELKPWYVPAIQPIPGPIGARLTKMTVA